MTGFLLRPQAEGLEDHATAAAAAAEKGKQGGGGGGTQVALRLRVQPPRPSPVCPEPAPPGPRVSPVGSRSGSEGTPFAPSLRGPGCASRHSGSLSPAGPRLGVRGLPPPSVSYSCGAHPKVLKVAL